MKTKRLKKIVKEAVTEALWDNVPEQLRGSPPRVWDDMVKFGNAWPEQWPSLYPSVSEDDMKGALALDEVNVADARIWQPGMDDDMPAKRDEVEAAKMYQIVKHVANRLMTGTLTNYEEGVELAQQLFQVQDFLKGDKDA